MSTWEAKPLMGKEMEGLEDAEEFLRTSSNSASSWTDSGAKTRKWQIITVIAMSLTTLAAVLPAKPKLSSALSGESAEGAQMNENAAATTTKRLGFSIKSGNYDDAPGRGYAFIDETRFVEPFRSSKFEVSGEGITSCDWSVKHASGTGPWDDFVGVEKAATFAKHGTVSASKMTSSKDEAATEHGTGLEFSVMFSAPGTYHVNVVCSLEDGSTSSMHEEVNATAMIKPSSSLTHTAPLAPPPSHRFHLYRGHRFFAPIIFLSP